MNEEVWLIEHNSINPHRWLRLIVQPCGNRVSVEIDYTETASIAMQFGRREDAEAFIYLHPRECINCRATSHMFIGRELACNGHPIGDEAAAQIENLESLTQGIDWDKWHDAAEILASQEQWRRVAGELEQKLSAERERIINRLLYLVPMASMELTTEYLRKELAKETPMKKNKPPTEDQIEAEIKAQARMVKQMDEIDKATPEELDAMIESIPVVKLPTEEQCESEIKAQARMVARLRDADRAQQEQNLHDNMLSLDGPI